MLTKYLKHYIILQQSKLSLMERNSYALLTKGNDMNIIENIYTTVYSYEYYECSLVSEGIGGA